MGDAAGVEGGEALGGEGICIEGDERVGGLVLLERVVQGDEAREIGCVCDEGGPDWAERLWSARGGERE